MNKILIITIIVGIAGLICYLCSQPTITALGDTKGSNIEEYSYHFGFPTWGAVDNRIRGLSPNYGVFRNYNPFMRNYYPRRNYRFRNRRRGYGINPYFQNYYDDSIRPYITNEGCYNLKTKNEDCVPGYYKTKIMSGKNPELLKCCLGEYL